MTPIFALYPSGVPLHHFDEVEVHPVRDYGEFVEVIDAAEFGKGQEGELDYWSVYLHFDPAHGCGVVCVADVPSEVSADALAAGLRAAVLDSRLEHQRGK